MAANPVPNPQHNLTIEHLVTADGIPTLLCSGRIWLETSGLFKSEVKKLAPNHKQILADLSGVSFVDSSGLGAVLASFMSAKSVGCELKLVNVQRQIRDLLDMTKLAAVFDSGNS